MGKRFCKLYFLSFTLKKSQIKNLDYGDWCLKFAVSVSWRVLSYGLSKGLTNLSVTQLEDAKEAEKTWREFLLGSRKHPGIFCQHLIYLDLIKSISFENPSPFLHRYILRSIEMDIPSNKSRAFVYVKLGRLILFGIIQERFPKH